MRILEVCAADIRSVEAAARANAPRIELCTALSEGGTTPSEGMIDVARKIFPGKIHILIRPRGGDFVYSETEAQVMLRDIEKIRMRGDIEGVVIGALTPNGDIDMPLCQRLVEAAGDMNITFHRAFDRCINAEKALEDVISLGCNRLLTSGQHPSAQKGLSMLAALQQQNNRRIVILAGAGVNDSNVAEIASVADEVHASASEPFTNMQRTNTTINDSANDMFCRSSSETKIRNILQKLNTPNI